MRRVAFRALSAPLAVGAACRSSVSAPATGSSSSSTNTPATTATTKVSSPASKGASPPTTSDKADASFIGEDIPFSSLSHQLTKLFLARRLVLPAVAGAGAWALMPTTATALHWCAVATVTALLQRLSVRGATNRITADLTGKVAVVTGATSGIGLATVVQLLHMNATVCIVSRPGKVDTTKSYLVAHCPSLGPELLSQRVSFVETDFMDLQQVAIAGQRVQASFPKIDFLVNNAGLLVEEPKLSKQNIEEHIAVNFVAPVLLTEVLLPALRKAQQGARIVNVSCNAHVGVRKGNVVHKRLLIKPEVGERQVTSRCYSASKLGNIYHAQWLAARRYEGVQFDTKQQQARPFAACAVDPGVVNTALDRTERLFGNSALANAWRSLWLKDANEGAQSVVNCLVREDFENGGYYVECRLMPSALSRMSLSTKEQNEVCKWALHKVEKFLPNKAR